MEIAREIEQVYRRESRAVHATLIRLLGDFDQAEEGLHEAFAAALEQWSRDGIPRNPRSWLISVGRFKSIDRMRRDKRFETLLPRLIPEPYHEEYSDEIIPDDQLRLIFTCCHPALSEEARIALPLREVCGLTTEAIASAFLVKPTTVAQRIVRAKRKIRQASIPYEIPDETEILQRIDAVLCTIYLVFNEGYYASEGELIRADLSAEAIRLCRHFHELLPQPEVKGLLALMLLQESRRKARLSPEGDIIILEEQDRNLWDAELIAEGISLVEQALPLPGAGTYSVQAAVAAVHSEATSVEGTNWAEIVALYDVLLQMEPSPIIELNRAVALAMHASYEEGLAVIDQILQRGELKDYYLIHAARADLCRRLTRNQEAAHHYQKALMLTRQESVRKFIQKRLQEIA